MNKYFGAVITIGGIIIWLFIGMAFFTDKTVHSPICPNDPYRIDQFPLKEKKWHCHELVTCEWADWRYTNPKDVCRFIEVTQISPINPVVGEAYGAHCEEIN